MNINYNQLEQDINAILPSSITALQKHIETQLNKAGLFFRIFSRVKTSESTIKKMQTKDYSDVKKLQDLIGIRIVLYFVDDIDICKNILLGIFEKISESIDSLEPDTFKPIRTNIIFNIPDDFNYILDSSTTSKYPIDTTFEVQIRTVFSEGWHEVEHDFKYKCKNDWEDVSDLSRTMNGIVATLENCDWSILMLLDELSYKQYKNNNWIPMLRHKYRVRLKDYILDEKLITLFNENHRIAKYLMKVDRGELLKFLASPNIKIPINLNNLVYVANYLFIKDSAILNITPELILDELKKTI